MSSLSAAEWWQSHKQAADSEVLNFLLQLLTLWHPQLVLNAFSHHLDHFNPNCTIRQAQIKHLNLSIVQVIEPEVQILVRK